MCLFYLMPLHNYDKNNSKNNKIDFRDHFRLTRKSVKKEFIDEREIHIFYQALLSDGL